MALFINNFSRSKLVEVFYPINISLLISSQQFSINKKKERAELCARNHATRPPVSFSLAECKTASAIQF